MCLILPNIFFAVIMSKKLEELKISLTQTPPIIYILLTLFSQLSLI